MDSLSLKLAQPKDIQTIYRLAEKIWHYHYVPIIGSEQVEYMLARMYSDTSLKEQMVDQHHLFHLLFEGNLPVGFIAISGEKDYFLHKFYIDQDVQSKGYGKWVFEEILRLHPDIQSLTLTVNRKNYKSINFYFKLGFKIDRIEDFDIGDGYYMNDFIMRWEKA